jgi:hypothetical protein
MERCSLALFYSNGKKIKKTEKKKYLIFELFQSDAIIMP